MLALGKCGEPSALKTRSARRASALSFNRSITKSWVTDLIDRLTTSHCVAKSKIRLMNSPRLRLVWSDERTTLDFTKNITLSSPRFDDIVAELLAQSADVNLQHVTPRFRMVVVYVFGESGFRQHLSRIQHEIA